MKLFAALHDDKDQGWVWLHDTQLRVRCVVKITVPESGKSIYCEALQIDDNFLKTYNQSPRFCITDPASSLVINYWFRAKLGGLGTQSDVLLTIKPCKGWWGKIKSCIDHPQIVVRISVWLSLIGLILGIVGLVLGVLSLCPRA